MDLDLTAGARRLTFRILQEAPACPIQSLAQVAHSAMPDDVLAPLD